MEHALTDVSLDGKDLIVQRVSTLSATTDSERYSAMQLLLQHKQLKLVCEQAKPSNYTVDAQTYPRATEGRPNLCFDVILIQV